MADLKLYLREGILLNVGQPMGETDPGANATISPNYGYNTATEPAGDYAPADAQTVVAFSAFTTTVQPDGTLITTQGAGDFWRSEHPYSGSSVGGTGTFQGSVIGNSALTTPKGKNRWKLFYGDADGTNLVEITSATAVGSEVQFSNTAQTDSAITATLASFTIENKYLFAQCAWEITVAGSGKGSGLINALYRVGTTASHIIVPSFVQSVTQTVWKPSGNVVNVADVNPDWNVPGNAQVADGSVAQWPSTLGFVDVISDYIRADTFGFAIPTGSTIDKIIASVDFNSDTATAIYWNSVFLIVGGATSGADQSDVAVWPVNPAEKKFTWTTSLPTVAQINASDFGWQLQVIQQAGLAEIARIDVMRMTIYYTPPSDANLRMLMGVGT